MSQQPSKWFCQAALIFSFVGARVWLITKVLVSTPRSSYDVARKIPASCYLSAYYTHQRQYYKRLIHDHNYAIRRKKKKKMMMMMMMMNNQMKLHFFAILVLAFSVEH